MYNSRLYVMWNFNDYYEFKLEKIQCLLKKMSGIVVPLSSKSNACKKRQKKSNACWKNCQELSGIVVPLSSKSNACKKRQKKSNACGKNCQAFEFELFWFIFFQCRILVPIVTKSLLLTISLEITLDIHWITVKKWNH